MKCCLNSINSDLYSLYRLYYFQLPFDYTKQIDLAFVNFFDRFNYVFKEFSKGNSAFVYSNIEVIFDSNFIIVDNLLRFANLHKMVSLKYKVKSTKLTLNLIYDNYKKQRKGILNDYDRYKKPIIKLRKVD